MMNKAKITSVSLMDDAYASFVNLKNMGNWKTEISRNTQIIALTTQITALETKVTKLSSAKALTGHPATPDGATGTPGGAGTGNYTFELWHLEKVDSKAEHSMIERDGKTWYWCDNHTYNNKGVVTQGMYVFHKPGAEHDAWRAKKDRFKKGGPKEHTVTTPKVPTPATGSSDPSAAKHSLSKSLQAALVHNWFVCGSISKDLGRCLQRVRKLDGPECRIESIMDIFLIPIIFLIRAAISILLLLRVIFSVRTVSFLVGLIVSSVGILHESNRWTGFLTWIAITSRMGRFMWSLIQVFFIVPNTIYTFFRGVYDFGPKHHKRTLFDILLNPVPGIEFEGRLGESDDLDSL